MEIKTTSNKLGLSLRQATGIDFRASCSSRNGTSCIFHQEGSIQLSFTFSDQGSKAEINLLRGNKKELLWQETIRYQVKDILSKHKTFKRFLSYLKDKTAFFQQSKPIVREYKQMEEQAIEAFRTITLHPVIPGFNIQRGIMFQVMTPQGKIEVCYKYSQVCCQQNRFGKEEKLSMPLTRKNLIGKIKESRQFISEFIHNKER